MKNNEKIAEIVIMLLYEVMFPLEDYQTAEYINGRRERAFDYYAKNSIFAARINKTVALIIRSNP